jgi:hypothetical protein
MGGIVGQAVIAAPVAPELAHQGQRSRREDGDHEQLQAESGHGPEPHSQHAMSDPLPLLSSAELETLLAALDPVLDGFAAGGSCLDDASAYLDRLGVPCQEGQASSPLLAWIEAWRGAGGNRETLRLMVRTLIADREANG